MIIVRITGGLGNQMFQYATAKALASHTGTKLELDVNELKPNLVLNLNINRSLFEKEEKGIK